MFDDDLFWGTIFHLHNTTCLANRNNTRLEAVVASSLGPVPGRIIADLAYHPYNITYLTHRNNVRLEAVLDTQLCQLPADARRLIARLAHHHY